MFPGLFPLCLMFNTKFSIYKNIFLGSEIM